MMKVFYAKDKHVIILFPKQELQQALGVLKALAKYFKAWFLVDVAAELEADLEEKKLPAPTPAPIYHHICENCFTEIDVLGKDKNNHVFVDSSYIHVNCPVLKENRPI